MAGCEQGFIDKADFQFSFGEATDPLTEEDEKGSAKS